MKKEVGLVLLTAMFAFGSSSPTGNNEAFPSQKDSNEGDEPANPTVESIEPEGVLDFDIPTMTPPIPPLEFTNCDPLRVTLSRQDDARAGFIYSDWNSESETCHIQSNSANGWVIMGNGQSGIGYNSVSGGISPHTGTDINIKVNENYPNGFYEGKNDVKCIEEGGDKWIPCGTVSWEITITD